MLTVMVFLPAAFAFSFRAVGMYRTEDLVNPHASVQAAAVCGAVFHSGRRRAAAVVAAADAHLPGIPAVRPLP